MFHALRFWLLLAILLGSWLSLPMAVAATTVRIAPDPDFAPIDGFDSRGRHQGLTADLLTLLAARSELRFEVQRHATLTEARAALAAGRVDLLASVLRSPAREASLRFSRPYLRLPAALIGRPGAEAPTSLTELRGRRIAVVEGRLWSELLSEQGYAEQLLPVASISAALQAVADGRAAAYIGDLPSAERTLRRLGLADELGVLGNSGLEADLAFAGPPASAALIAQLDAALALVSVEEEAALQARWLAADAEDAESAEPVPASLATELATVRSSLPADLPEREDLLAQLDTALAVDAEADTVLAAGEQLAARVAAATVTLAAPELPTGAGELLRWRSSLPQRASLEDLEQMLATEQANRGSLLETSAQVASELALLRERPVTLRRELAALGPLGTTGLSDGVVRTPAKRVADAVAAANRRLQLARQAVLLQEQAELDTLVRAAERQQRERQQALLQREERISVLEQRIAEQGDSELLALLERLRAEQLRQLDAAAPLREAAAANLASGERMLKQSRRLGLLREQLQRLERQSFEVARALANAQARVEIGGINAAVGRLLMAERRKLPSASAIRSQQRALQAERVEVRLAQLAVSDEREQLGSLRAAVEERLGSDYDIATAADPALRAALTDLLLQRAELLPQLELQQQRLTEVLEKVEQQLQRLTTDSLALSGLIKQHLLWVPSHPPWSRPWLTPLWTEFTELLKPQRWEGSGRRLLAQLTESPLWWALLTLPILLWSLWPTIDRALAQRAVGTPATYTPTLVALALTMMRAAPMALLLLLLGQLLQSAGEGGRFTNSLGRALAQLAPHVYLATLLIASCRPGGLADAHLRWPTARREALLQLRPWLYFLLMPLLLLAALGEARDLEYPGGLLLQLSLVLSSLVLAGIGGWLLAPGRLLSGPDGQPDPLPKLRRGLQLGMVGGGLLLAVLPLAGYLLTVGILLDTLLGTLWVLYVVLLGHGLVWRWLVLSERRLAEAQRQLAPPAPVLDETGLAPPQEEQPDLELVGTQSHGLLRATTAMLLATGLLWSMAAVAPAFALLDTVTLWQTVSEVDGARVASAVTLGDVLLALAALVFGVIAARNLPGLLELLLLQHFTGDASLRYAVVTISRYVITFLLLVLVFGLLGVRWGHLQWLAAAFSVGLGFGLQEIFGNFVAGLILLFERPFRVGDVVTIGEYTGTVRKIRTRATTIVDFDNKDVVIPNKAFITDRFVNWTLSDSSTRITLKVGVDYHADAEVVRSMLLAIAAAHPAVMKEPAPVAWFLEFGGSALHFELRCFVATIADRLRVTDALHAAILTGLRERGIGIPYPQLDVHLHRQAAPTGG